MAVRNFWSCTARCVRRVVGVLNRKMSLVGTRHLSLAYAFARRTFSFFVNVFVHNLGRVHNIEQYYASPSMLCIHQQLCEGDVFATGGLHISVYRGHDVVYNTWLVPPTSPCICVLSESFAIQWHPGPQWLAG